VFRVLPRSNGARERFGQRRRTPRGAQLLRVKVWACAIVAPDRDIPQEDILPEPGIVSLHCLEPEVGEARLKLGNLSDVSPDLSDTLIVCAAVWVHRQVDLLDRHRRVKLR